MAREEFLKGLTVKTLVIGIIAAFILSMMVTFNHISPSIHNRISAILDHYAIGVRDTMYTRSATHTWSALGVFALTMLLVLLVNKARPNTFSPQEIAILAVMIPFSALIQAGQCGGPWQWMPNSPRALLGIYYNDPAVGDLVLANFPLPSMVNQAEIWQTLAEPYTSMGFVMSNFGAMMIWNMLWVLVPGLTFLFLALLIRPLLIDIEDVPIYFSELQVDLVSATQPESFKWDGRGIGGRALTLFAIAFIIQFVWASLGHWYDTLYPFIRGPLQLTGTTWDDNFSGWLWGNVGVQICPVAELTDEAILNWVPLHIMMTPYSIAWGYLLPIDVLVGWCIGYFPVWLFLPLILDGMGVLGTYAPGNRCRAIPGRLWGYGELSGFLPFMYTGMFFALAIYPVWRARHQISPVFKALWQKVDPEFEARSPIPYRVIWLGLIVCFVIWMALASPMGGTLPVSLFIGRTIVEMIMYTGLARMLLETGGAYFAMAPGADADSARLVPINAGLWYNYGRSLYGEAALTNESYWIFQLPYQATSSGGMEGSVLFVGMIVLWFSLATFKTGRELRTDNRDWFKAMLIALLIAVPMAIFWMWFWYAIMPIVPGWETYAWTVDHPITRYTGPLEAGTWPTPSYQPGLTTYLYRNIGGAALGFILIALMYILRGRFPRLPISPTGLALGTMQSYMYLAPFPIALIFKWITLKVAGTEFYNRTAKPLCIGLIAGFMAFIFITQWLSIITSIRYGFAFAATLE